MQFYDPKLCQDRSSQSNSSKIILGATINITWEGKNPEEQVLFAQMDVDDQFVDLFIMKMIAGRKFSKDFKTEGKSYIVNEKALDIMGFSADQAIGKSFTLWDGPGTIVGVVHDFHFKPIQQPIDPMVLRYNDRGNYVMLRTSGGRTEETIATLENINKELNPDYPFEYGFFDQDLDQLYQSEKRLSKLVNIFAILAIFISCLGLYGLSAYLADGVKRKSEYAK